MASKIIKIALTGAESTGKSTLSKALANHFNTCHTIEFARHFLEINGNHYTYNDILFMAKKQLELENEMEKSANNFLFCDTDFINFKIWLEHLNYEVPSWLLNHIKSKPYHLSLLMKPDIAWQPDPLREYPHKREHFYNLFKQNLLEFEYNFVEIEGQNKSRFEMAKNAVISML
jgi:NadR type nicotinamide-nucleotide adenylyltransferase